MQWLLHGHKDMIAEKSFLKGIRKWDSCISPNGWQQGYSEDHANRQYNLSENDGVKEDQIIKFFRI